ncbi:MAG: SDR family oxidoreductase [Gemmatimonadetes bacterium]|nr:SDR family oxidoreductase [Gemmatimonadota bacterium]
MSVFSNKVVFITGASSGIGRAIAEKLGAQGAVIVATDINGTGAEAVAAGLRARNCRAEALTLDVTQADAVRAAIEGAAERHGHLDYVFNNAGIGFRGEVRDATLEQWKLVLDVNLLGVIHGVQAAYPIMVRQGSGHIVNTASLAGLVVAPLLAPYAAAKAGVVALSRALRVEGAALGVKVTALCPGFIDTGIYAAAVTAGTSQISVKRSVPFPIAPLDASVDELLAGVMRNDELVVLPKIARTAWLFTRLWPRRLEKMLMSQVRRFRKDERAPA